MELRSLVEVELREALSPINRSARGDFVPALRTVAQLRERVACGLLDLKLSRACVVAGHVAATCLVERLADEGSAYIDALSADSLAQQRGASRALVEAVQAATAGAGVSELSLLASDMDSALHSVLQAAGFVRRQSVGRYTLPGPPSAQPIPAVRLGAEEPPRGLPWIQAITLADAGVRLAALQTVSPLFPGRLAVLTRLAGRLSAFAYVPAGAAVAAASAVLVCDRERKLLCALAGEPDALTALLSFAASRHGIAHLDALAESDPAVAALTAAGFSRTALRVEMVCDPRAVAASPRSTQAAGSAPGAKGRE